MGSGAPRVYEGLVVEFGVSGRARIGNGPLQAHQPNRRQRPTGGTSLSRFGSSSARLQRTVGGRLGGNFMGSRPSGNVLVPGWGLIRLHAARIDQCSLWISRHRSKVVRFKACRQHFSGPVDLQLVLPSPTRSLLSRHTLFPAGS